MAGVAQGVRKMSSEMLDHLEDKIAALKATNTPASLKEAAEAEVELARVRKQHTRDTRDGVFDEPDATDWSKPMLSGADKPRATFDENFPGYTPENKSTSFGVDASSWEQPLDITPTGMSRGKKAAAAGATAMGGAGLYTALQDEEKAPAEPMPLTPEKQQDSPTELALGAGGMPAKAAPTIDKSEMPIIKDILSTIAEPPKGVDFTEWGGKMEGLAGEREKLASQLKQDIISAQAAADVASSSLERRELIETITNAVGQMVSGLYGLRTGLDLSGAKFHRTDWNAKMEQLRNLLRDNVNILTQQQQLDQALIDDKRNTLMQQKDSMLQKYNQAFQAWQGKASVSQARQGLEVNKAQMELQNNQFNINQERLAEQAAREAAARGAAPRDQISAGLKAVTGERESVLKRWNQLAAEANDKKLSSDQRRAKMNEMEQLDRKYAEMTGLALLPSDKDPSIPASYMELDPDDMVEAASGSFAKRDALMVRAYEKNPRYFEILKNQDTEIAKMAEDTLAAQPSMGSVAAMKHATQEYYKAVRMIMADIYKPAGGSSPKVSGGKQ